MISINTNKLLVITWVAMAFLIGTGVGYLLGIKGVGQQNPTGQQQNFGLGPQGQQQGGNVQQPVSQGEAPPGAPGGRNPASYVGTQGQPLLQQNGRPTQQANPNQR